MKEICQYFHKKPCHVSFFTGISQRHASIDKKIFMGHATGITLLYIWMHYAKWGCAAWYGCTIIVLPSNMGASVVNPVELRIIL